MGGHEKETGADRAADAFYDAVRSREDDFRKVSGVHAKIVAEKDAHLIQIRRLLKRLADAGVVVGHRDAYDRSLGSRHMPPQMLSVTEGESSPKWSPGVSLYIDHPALLEVAVVNAGHRKQNGLIAIGCSSEHPDRHTLGGPFFDTDQACMALAEFLSRNTVRIERPDILRPDDDPITPL